MGDLDPALWARVAAARVAHLATTRHDGTPHVVPITFALLRHDGADVVVSAIDAKPKRTLDLARLANLAAQPVASVLVDRYDDDWSQLWWVRADGPTEVLRYGPRRDAALDDLAAKYAPYRDTRPPGPVIALTVGRWTTWAAAR